MNSSTNEVTPNTNNSVKRLLLNPSSYYLHPIATIKSILGKDIKVVSHTPQSIITPSDDVIVDVVYTRISPTSTPNSLTSYTVQTNSLKPIAPGSNVYIGQVDSYTFQITDPPTTDTFKVHLFSGDNPTQEISTALVVENNFTTVLTPLKYPGWEHFTSAVDKLELGSSTSSKQLLTDHVPIYTEAIKQFSILHMIDNLIPVSTSSELPNSDTINTTAYVIDIRLLYNELIHRPPPLRGVIFASDLRVDKFIVVWFPTSSFTLTHDELKATVSFVIDCS